MAHHSSVNAGTLPFWIDSASISHFNALDHDLDVDVAVVVGGLTGLTVAYLLATQGKSVAVLERDRCGQIDTGRTTAHLTMVTDARLKKLEAQLGRPHTQAVWDAGLAAIAEIARLVRAHGIDCDFEWVDGYLHAPIGAVDREDVNDLREEAALAQELGFDAEFVDEVPFAKTPGIRFTDQARFHPVKYLAALTKEINAAGGEIFERSPVDEFFDDPLGIRTGRHRIRCRDIVLATHNPLVGVESLTGATLFQTKLALYSSYVIAGRVARESVPDALYWDTGDPYHYLRIEPHGNHDLVIYGGEDHKTGQVSDTDACFERLERDLTAQIPKFSVSHRWSGQIIETPDGLPYIGRMTDHQYAATGFSGNGMTFGTLAGMMIADAILEGRNPWTDLFEPGRKALRHGLWEYIKENADYPYYMIRDRFAGAEGRSLRAVKRGSGKVIEYRGTKAAVYRDEDGATTVRSATCTHMGCLVGWNAAERTWDCPCHGSRFAPEGGVISGPAESPLPEVTS
jgi:glycine/D-amino acid oxidase-like deaminating enzyme/nitrite reductase/ring-hydroxylating ferredoxin subunit